MIKLTRTDRSAGTALMYTVDKAILVCILILMGAGLFLGYGASPAVAKRIGAPEMHFFWRQFMFILVALPMMIGIAMFDANRIRKLGIAVFAGALILLLALPFVGMEAKGATRWISIASFTLQPSEFLKPGFIIVLAALFSQVTEENRVRISAFAALLTLGLVVLLVRQPDYGQTSLLAASFVILLHLSGAPRLWIGSLLAAGIGFFAVAFTTVDHVRKRLMTWFDPAAGDTYQIDKSIAAFKNGGIGGRGIGEGRVKDSLPDAHTDFIFAATAEEFGLFACLALMSVFAVIVWRGLKRSLEAIDPFTQLAIAGLVSLFGLQAVVNMGVTMKVLPTKGMTLPLVSYGGSSLLALAITTGMILALTRKRAGQTARLKTHGSGKTRIHFDNQGVSGSAT